MTPLKIGAALTLDRLSDHRDWLFEADRDLEVQDFAYTGAFANGWRETVDRARAALDGFKGRVGIHGPFWGLDIANPDPGMAKLTAPRFTEAVEAAAAMDAQWMVVHSPFDNWSTFNQHAYGDPIAKAAEDLRVCLGPALALAEAHGVTLVMENIKDVTPVIRRQLVEHVASPALKLSIDTGHAHIAARASGAPPVDVFVKDAGALLRHVHLQDGDGWADRHWVIGEGDIGWAEVFRALAETAPDAHLVLELRRHAEVPAGFAWLRDRGLAV